jgi:hypothetical protein
MAPVQPASIVTEPANGPLIPVNQSSGPVTRRDSVDMRTSARIVEMPMSMSEIVARY